MAEQNNNQQQDVNQLLKVRYDKLHELQENGKDPFVITKYDVTNHSTDVKEHFEEMEGSRLFAKIRYNHRGGWCSLKVTGPDEITCTFEEPQRAVTPGQALVLYGDGYILGGGRIL